MTTVASPNTNSLSLVDVGNLCADLAASSLQLFQLAGRCAAGGEAGDRQRRYAAASQRHGWHRELAFERSPRVPIIAPIEVSIGGSSTALTPGEADETSSVDDAEDAWRQQAEALRDRLLATYPRLHPELDPATARLIQLVVSDLDELLQEIAARSR